MPYERHTRAYRAPRGLMGRRLSSRNVRSRGFGAPAPRAGLEVGPDLGEAAVQVVQGAGVVDHDVREGQALLAGRLGGPLDTAWQLARAWPDAELTVVEEAGHLGTEATRGYVRNALDRFADR